MRTAILIFLSLFSSYAFAQGEAGFALQKDSVAVKQLFFAGLRDKLMGNAEASTISFLKILTIDKSNDAAFYELANASLRLNNLPDATQYAKEAARLKPNNKFYLEILAQALKEANNLADLKLVLDNLIELDPDNSAYYFDKANTQLRSNQNDDAEETYKIIQQKFGSSLELTNAKSRIGQKDITGGNIVKLLENNDATVKDYLYAAGTLMQDSKNDESLKILEKAEIRFPESYQIKLSMADVYKKDGDLTKSIEVLKSAFVLENMPVTDKIQIVGGMFSKIGEEAIAKNINELVDILVKQNPNDAKVFGLYGDILFRLGNFDSALTQYEKALKLDDQIFNVWEGVINTHNLLGQYAQAIKVSDEALTIYPNQASLYFFAAYAKYRTSKLDDALKNLETAVALGLDDRGLLAQSYALKADILIDKNNFAGAKSAFNEAVKQEPNNYQILTKVAYFLALRGEDLEVAEGYAKTAANAEPENPAITDTYAFVLFKHQKYTEAKKWIELTLKNKRLKYDVYLEHYGDILFLLGDKEKAIQQWELAKNAGNNSKVLSKKLNEKKYFK